MAEPVVFIAVPAYGCQVHKNFATSLLRLQATLSQMRVRTIVEFLGNESLITRGRSILAEKMLRSPATHLLFLDADIVFAAESIVRLLEADLDVACGAYAKKGLMVSDIAKLGPDATERDVAACAIGYNVNLQPGERHAVDRGFIEAREAATGVMLIKREVLERLKELHDDKMVKNDIAGSRDAVPEYCLLFDTGVCPETKRFLSEDYEFCTKARAAGFKVVVDVASTYGHCGNFTRTATFASTCKLAV